MEYPGSRAIPRSRANLSRGNCILEKHNSTINYARERKFRK